MNKHEKSLAENYDRMRIGVDDSFQFHCTMCGKCCINREDILLNAYDLYRMAKELKRAPSDVYQEYCESYLGNNSNMVVVRLVPRGRDKRCPLLNGRKCSIHKGKPTVCALYPLGRGFKLATDKAINDADHEVEYILQDRTCGDLSETHTVREWLRDFDLPVHDEFYIKWVQTVMNCGNLIKRLQQLVSANAVNMVCTAILGCIYLNYEIDAPFMPQFEANVKSFNDLMASVGLSSTAFDTQQN